jgi:hypothetical protein
MLNYSVMPQKKSYNHPFFLLPITANSWELLVNLQAQQSTTEYRPPEIVWLPLVKEKKRKNNLVVRELDQ